MRLHVIMGQRRCRYPGEHAPEALDVMDEYGADANPAWLEDQLKAHRADESFMAVEIITLRVPDDAIERLLSPPKVVVDAVVEPKE